MYRVLYRRHIFLSILLQMIITSMCLLSRVNGTIDFIFIGSEDPQRAYGKRKNAKWKIDVCKTLMSHFPTFENKLKLDLDIWPTDMNINRNHLQIKDNLP